MERIGRYQVLSELGRGSMGVVYEAVDPLIGRKVAVKTIRLGAFDDRENQAELSKRLYREAQAAGILAHPGILTIHDVGEQDKEAYIVMEFVDGNTVEQMLAAGTPLSTEALLSILKKTADALDYAHSRGIIHRDVKPSNIMLCRNGDVKVADFGIAKLSTSTSLTQSGFVVGTPDYMSPEQAQSGAVDGRSDQFSLAIVAYRMLSGKLPFEGPTLTAILAKILWAEPEYETAGIYPPVLNVFKKALSKDPKHRYTSCMEFVHEFEDAYKHQKRMPSPEVQSGKTTAAGADEKPPRKSKTEERVVQKNADEILSEREPVPPKPVSPVQKALTSIENQSELRPLKPERRPYTYKKVRRRSRLIARTFILVIVILAALAYFDPKEFHKMQLYVKNQFYKIMPILKKKTATVATSAKRIQNILITKDAEAPHSTGSDISAKKTESQTGSKRTGAGNPDVQEPVSAKREQYDAGNIDSRAGIIDWSGKLNENSILVITKDGASIGSMTGQLPGRPVKIDIEPATLSIRQMPDKTNNWARIILYSGAQQYTSVRIRWRTILNDD